MRITAPPGLRLNLSPPGPEVKLAPPVNEAKLVPSVPGGKTSASSSGVCLIPSDGGLVMLPLTQDPLHLRGHPSSTHTTPLPYTHTTCTDSPSSSTADPCAPGSQLAVCELARATRTVPCARGRNGVKLCYPYLREKEI